MPTLTTDLIPQRLSIRLKNVASFRVRLLDADTSNNPPLAYFRAKVERLDSAGKPDAALFAGRANKDGEIRFHLNLPKETPGQPNPALPKVKLTVLDLDGDPLHSETFQLQRGDPIPPVKVKTAPHQEKLVAPLDKWRAALGRTFSPVLQSLLHQSKVASLADLRAAKDLADSPGLSAADKQEVVLMQAHADLQLISRDHKTNQALVIAGYRSVLDVARESQTGFLAKVKGEIAEDTAGKLYVMAQRQVQVLGNLHTEQQARQANGMTALSYGGPADEPPCECNCGSAVSPQAYLVDLFDYAVDNVRFDGNAVDLQKLERTFGQPFAALPVDCAFADLLVRQVRLCVEVLHRRNVLLANNTVRAAVTSALAAHAPRAYEALLRTLGTSYRELRLVRSDTEARKRLADRLGIATDHVDRFRLELNSGDVNKQLNEDHLERLFGLQGTARDPLSTGAKFNDGQGQITRWQLRGVEWRKNTDDLGRIHVSVVKRPNGMHEIILFKSQTRGSSSRLAMGSTRDALGEVELVAANNSGLAGRIEFKYAANDSDIFLAVVPEWVVRRKEDLRSLWNKIDCPTSDFAAPMVDPDVVAEPDLMQPFAAHKAYTLWQSRKNSLQTKRDGLEKDAASRDRALSAMLDEVFGGPQDQSRWDGIADKLKSASAADSAAGETQLRALNLYLTSATFRFLLELWHRESDHHEIKATERQQALDVLVNIYKASLFETWKTEERDNGIRLSAPFFLLSEAEPVLNPLRASAEARGNWRAELERNSATPLIDPDIISESNFAPGATSTEAYGTWEDRRKLVGDGRRADDSDLPARVAGDLFNALATIDSVAKLNAALTTGDLPVGQGPLYHHIGFTAAEMDGIKEAIETGRKLPITPEQYGLTAAQLRTLFEVRRLGADADASDWEQVHHILVQVEKRRYLYPLWRIEEGADEITLSPDVFYLPSDALTELLPVLRLSPGFLQWRYDTRRQRAWRDQLKARVEQEYAVDAELQTAIDAAEEATLPALRDELVMATVSANTGGESLEECKRWVMNHLLINAFENGCRKTTRVAQGIETIQLLLWGIHSRQVEDVEGEKFSLEPASAETFAEEWRWLGSYATWRSAMFTYLYPENLLLPELRRAIEDYPDPDTDPTKLFRAILKVVSGEALPPPAPETGDDETDEPQPVEDEELTPFIEKIYRVLGEKKDPLTIEGQKIIFASLHVYWRSSIQDGEGNVDSFSARDSSDNPIYLPEQPADSEINPYYYVVGRLWFRYRTPSAFLEDVLYIPLAFALTQLKRGDFDAALYWFAKVYDFRGTPPTDKQGWVNPRLELYFRQRSATDIYNYPALDDWLSDKLNPHRTAATRTGADVRFVILSIIRCLLEYADSEFSKDTSESLARARELYETARRLLDSDCLGKKLGDCQDVIGTLISEIGEGQWVETVLPELDHFNPPLVDPDSLKDKALDQLLAQLKGVLNPTDPPKPKSEVRQNVPGIMSRHFAPKAPKTVEQSRLAGNKATQITYQRMLSQPQVFRQVQRAGAGATTASPLFVYAVPNQGVIERGPDRWVPAPNEFRFCIPRNPLIAMLRLRYEVSWFKLNNCMNLAGQHREVAAYAAPTDTYSGLPVAEVGSTAGYSAAARLVPTQYRYRVLIERARQLVAMAQQMEATYLSFLEKRDQEAYNILKARQDLGIARANVTLQDLRVTEADHGKTLAGYQYDRATEAFEHYEDLIDAGWTSGEMWAAGILIAAASVQSLAAIAGIIAGGFAGAAEGNPVTIAAGAVAGAAVGAAADAQGAGSALATTSSIFSMFASFERREQEWKFQKDLAEIDQDIAEAQQTLADDRYYIAEQEKRISEMSAENASDVVNFLNTKFTNTELYAWMGGIVGSIYRYLLQEATTIAKLAQRQLAFERQETELAVVQDDYWTYTDTSAILRGGSESSDRRGMTGSTRLLQDTTRLDQEAFLTDRRKLQLSKTLSLALHDPVAFARFQEGGVLPFTTTLKLFDRDFPGHYLRLIKRVRVSIVALVPPTEGIRATLSSSGISRVVRGGDTFAEKEIRRDPETIAFTSPINATGLFELQEQPEMLLPFEGNGVAATGWTFSMPRAANIVDYSTIADVLLTIEYTALDSAIYRSQVIQRLDRTASGERPFSFRHQFADCWYDLHNPDLIEPEERRMVVSFETRQADFPPNVDELSIQHVTLYIACKQGTNSGTEVRHLRFTEEGRAGAIGGSANSADGLISTRQGNAGSWTAMIGKAPIGRWELALPTTEEMKNRFKNEEIEDILLVVTYSGRTPPWPA